MNTRRVLAIALATWFTSGAVWAQGGPGGPGGEGGPGMGGPGMGGPGMGGRGGGMTGKIVEVDEDSLTLEMTMPAGRGGGNRRSQGLVPMQGFPGGGQPPQGPMQMTIDLADDTDFRQVEEADTEAVTEGSYVICLGTGDTCVGVGVYEPLTPDDDPMAGQNAVRALYGPLLVAVEATEENMPNELSGLLKAVDGERLTVTIRDRNGERDVVITLNDETVLLAAAPIENGDLEVGRYATVAPRRPEGGPGGPGGGPGMPGGGGGPGFNEGFQPQQGAFGPGGPGGGGPGGGGGMPRLTAAVVTQMPEDYEPPAFAMRPPQRQPRQ